MARSMAQVASGSAARWRALRRRFFPAKTVRRLSRLGRSASPGRRDSKSLGDKAKSHGPASLGMTVGDVHLPLPVAELVAKPLTPEQPSALTPEQPSALEEQSITTLSAGEVSPESPPETPAGGPRGDASPRDSERLWRWDEQVIKHWDDHLLWQQSESARKAGGRTPFAPQTPAEQAPAPGAAGAPVGEPVESADAFAVALEAAAETAQLAATPESQAASASSEAELADDEMEDVAPSPRLSVAPLSMRVRSLEQAVGVELNRSFTPSGLLQPTEGSRLRRKQPSTSIWHVVMRVLLCVMIVLFLGQVAMLGSAALTPHARGKLTRRPAASKPVTTKAMASRAMATKTTTTKLVRSKRQKAKPQTKPLPRRLSALSLGTTSIQTPEAAEQTAGRAGALERAWRRANRHPVVRFGLRTVIIYSAGSMLLLGSPPPLPSAFAASASTAHALATSGGARIGRTLARNTWRGIGLVASWQTQRWQARHWGLGTGGPAQRLVVNTALNSAVYAAWKQLARIPHMII